MYEDKHHPKADIIIDKIEAKFDITCDSAGYLPGPKIYAFHIYDLDLYQSKAFKKRIKILGMKYGKRKRFFFACIPRS